MRGGEDLTLVGLRERAGLPAKVVASQLGVSRKTLWTWENGYAAMPAGAAPGLAEVLGASVERVVEAHKRARDEA